MVHEQLHTFISGFHYDAHPMAMIAGVVGSLAAFYHNKVQTAIHFAYRALPTVPAKAAAIRSGEKATLYAIM